MTELNVRQAWSMKCAELQHSAQCLKGFDCSRVDQMLYLHEGFKLPASWLVTSLHCHTHMVCNSFEQPNTRFGFLLLDAK